MRHKPTLWVRAGLAAIAAALSVAAFAQEAPAKESGEDLMSAMGSLAKSYNEAILQQRVSSAMAARAIGPSSPTGLPIGVYEDSPSGGQAETSISIDATGQHVVVGFNDTRGFALNPASVSGFMYSDDGGLTFTDGGQLPSPGTDLIGATRFPQIFGDPEIVYMGGSNFLYFSIMVKKFTATGTAQTMCFHRSTDFGHTWTGPFEVTSATNPHGLLNGVNARDAADKEFAAADPETGRVIMSWSNFTSTAFAAGGVEISSTFCDNPFAAVPTWSPRNIHGATSADGQGSIPRFAGNGSNNVYIAWRRSAPGSNQNVGFVRSSDNGVTWTAAANTTTPFFTTDQIPGNDRINTNPSIAVDNTGGAFGGTIYLVYSNNNSLDGADVMLQRSLDGGATWTSPVALNSRPGFDRSQWFPWVCVDRDTGRVHVSYYDQGIAESGDMTEYTAMSSDDGGQTWSAPSPVTKQPFHAGYGNDTGQPNIGDYNQSVAQDGKAYHCYAVTAHKIPFTEGLPGGSFNSPDAEVTVVTGGKAPVRLGNRAFTDSHGDGNVDPGDRVTYTIPLNAYATAYGVTGVSATLSTTTPGVTVPQPNSTYPSIAGGGTANNDTPFKIRLSPSFVTGTTIELSLAVTTDQGTTTLLFDQVTGTATSTILYQTDFETSAGGFTVAHGGGNNTVAWTLGTNRLGTTGRSLFHINANDGLSGNHTRWERAFSPAISVPPGTAYTTMDFDIATNTEDAPPFKVWAWDGFFLRLTDLGPNPWNGVTLLRSVLAEAMVEDFTTGAGYHYPKHLPRNSSTAYFEDMSCWGGFSNGLQHVRMKVGDSISNRSFQMRFEYAQDVIGFGSVPGDAGVLVDNIVVRAWTLGPGSNDAPVAVNDSYNTDQDVAINESAPGVLGNDNDPDGDDITAHLLANAGGGNVVLATDGSFSYTPNPGFNGPDFFTYEVHDELGAVSGTATVNILVDGVPTANAGPDQTIECAGALTAATLDGSASSDPETQTLSYEWKEGATLVGSTAVVNVSLPHGPHTFTLKVTDTHGQSHTDTVQVDIVDTTPPVVTLNGAATMTVLFGSTFVDPGASATDVCDGTLPVTVTGSVNTGAVGTYVLTYTATDDSTNSASKTRTVKVVYGWSNFLQPINTDGSSIFKKGSTVPVKFQLTGGSAGQVITAHIYVAQVSGNVIGSEIEPVGTSAADVGNTFRYSGGQYHFNLNTKNMAVGTWQIRVDLGDGENHVVLISLK